MPSNPELERTIIVIGGGASGVLLAANLVREGDGATRVLLIEKSGRLGAGLAYSTLNPNHILNVPASAMSAFPNDPDHFLRWLRGTGAVDATDPHIFAPRYLYSQYLSSLLAAESGITIVPGACAGITELPSGVEVRLENGTTLTGRCAVLAVGHEERQIRGRGLAVRAGSSADTPLDPYAKTMILGSGLSMVDAWLSLAGNGHRGPILVVSRNGLLPRKHRQVEPVALDPDEIPFGASTHRFARWFLGTLRNHLDKGKDWRAVVDGLRPYIQRIWQNWSIADRRRFLSHLRPFWNIHRHRLPPHIHDRLTAAVDAGQITVIAGTFTGVERDGDHLIATVRRRGLATSETFDVARLYDCGGVAINIEESSNPVINGIVKTGLGRPDALKIGLDVTTDGALISRTGTVSQRVFALGPLTRGTFFEIESVPEIRVEAQRLAHRLGQAPTLA